jgi:hypothetical protein
MLPTTSTMQPVLTTCVERVAETTKLVSRHIMLVADGARQCGQCALTATQSARYAPYVQIGRIRVEECRAPFDGHGNSVENKRRS